MGRWADGQDPGTGIVLALALLGAAAACTTGPSGAAAASPAEVTFGPTPVGGHATTTVRVTNVATSGDLTVESTVVTGTDRGDFSDDFITGGADGVVHQRGPGPRGRHHRDLGRPRPSVPGDVGLPRRGARYLRNLLVVLSASTFPPVWQVGQ
jgi:hypothetical protein